MWSQEGRKVESSQCDRKKVGSSRYGREKGNDVDRRYFDSGMRSSK
jgi:hypothetical protein